MGQREAQAANSIPVNGDAARFFAKNAQRSSSQMIQNNVKDIENKAEMRNSTAQSSSGECSRDSDCLLPGCFFAGTMKGMWFCRRLPNSRPKSNSRISRWMSRCGGEPWKSNASLCQCTSFSRASQATESEQTIIFDTDCQARGQ